MDLRLTFNEVPELYDRLRPTYVTELYRDIEEYSGISDKSRILEIGIGTGQATRPFLEMGCDVTAIELGENLAAFTKEKFKSYDNFEIINMAFEEYECPENTFDMIYSASAFHWIPEDIGYLKVLRLLKNGGTFARFANHPYKDKGNESLHVAIQELYEKYMPHISLIKPVEYNEEMASKRSKIGNKYGFIDTKCELYHRIRPLNAKDYSQIIKTFSDHRIVGEEKLELFLIKTEEAVMQHGGIINLYDTQDLQLARNP